MKTYLKLEITSNAGYTARDAAESRCTITVGALREMLDGLDDDVEIVTFDEGNLRGAAWGTICADQWTDIIEADDDDDEDE